MLLVATEMLKMFAVFAITTITLFAVFTFLITVATNTHSRIRDYLQAE